MRMRVGLLFYASPILAMPHLQEFMKIMGGHFESLGAKQEQAKKEAEIKRQQEAVRKQQAAQVQQLIRICIFLFATLFALAACWYHALSPCDII